MTLRHVRIARSLALLAPLLALDAVPLPASAQRGRPPRRTVSPCPVRAPRDHATCRISDEWFCNYDRGRLMRDSPGTIRCQCSSTNTGGAHWTCSASSAADVSDGSRHGLLGPLAPPETT